jgi:hypothetical protein
MAWDPGVRNGTDHLQSHVSQRMTIVSRTRLAILCLGAHRPSLIDVGNNYKLVEYKL